MRVETGGNIMEVLINEDILDPEGETISLCFSAEQDLIPAPCLN